MPIDRTPTYISWIAMNYRCRSPNSPDYPRYGGRGITVCDRWKGKQGFANFLKDMGERPIGMSIDRINNDGNYTPENCRWATAKEQAANRMFKPSRKQIPTQYRKPYYKKWLAMRSSCNNPNNPTYKNCGAKGIKVCDRWSGKDGYENFYADITNLIGAPPTKDHQLTRIDKNADYSPANIHWITKQEFQRTKSKPITNPKSGFRGVYWIQSKSYWVVYVYHQGKNIYIGSFKDKYVAARAYNKQVVEHQGESAILNSF